VINPFSWLKHRLSHPKENSLHFQATKTFWSNNTYGKACTYYWFKLPTALLLWTVACIFLFVGSVIGAFFGFVSSLFEPGEERLRWYHKTQWFYPYKTLPSGRRIPVAPWEIAVIVAVCYAIYYLALVDQGAGKVSLLVLVGVAVFCSIVFAISKSWRHPLLVGTRSGVSRSWNMARAAWNKVCPELEVEPK